MASVMECFCSKNSQRAGSVSTDAMICSHDTDQSRSMSGFLYLDGDGGGTLTSAPGGAVPSPSGEFVSCWNVGEAGVVGVVGDWLPSVTSSLPVPSNDSF